jgi:hypothetical protein
MMDKASLAVVAPEIFLLLMACVIAMVDLGVKTRLRNLTYGLTMLTLGLIAWYTGDLASRGDTAYAFNRMLVSDSMANWLKCFSAISMMVCLVYGRPVRGRARHAARRRAVHAGHVRAAGHLHDDLGQQLPGDLPGAWNCSRCPATRWWRCAATTRWRPKRR